MGSDSFRSHSDRARRAQWRLEDLPWDEPIEFCGGTRREKTICKLDMVDIAEAMYHFELGGRVRMGHHMIHSLPNEESIAEVLEWHDIDEQRHVRALRRLIARLRATGDSVSEANHRPNPKRMWRVTYPERERNDQDRLLLNMLVDEAVCAALYDAVGRRSHVPLVKALCAACAADEARHVQYLALLISDRLKHRSEASHLALQARVIVHIVNLQSAFRPYLRSFAGASHSTPANIATELFRAISHALLELGPLWKTSPFARLVHNADHSPWIVWLLR